MAGKNLGRQRRGRPISARFLNGTAALAEANARFTVGVGLRSDEVAGSQHVTAIPFRLYRVQIPVGEVSDGASVDCLYYRADHLISPAGETITVVNRSGYTMGNASTTRTAWAAYNDVEAELQFINEVCPGS